MKIQLDFIKFYFEICDVSMESNQNAADILESLFVIPREVPKTVLRNLLELIYDVKVAGYENIPEFGGALIVSNHTDYLDIAVQGAFADRKIVYLGKYELFHPQEEIMAIINHKNSPFHYPPLSLTKPIIEVLLNSLGGVVKKNLINWGSMPIIRNAAKESEMDKRAAMEYYEKLENYMVDLMKDGELLSIYPEGSRSETGELQSFRAMAAKLAIRAGVPIVPSGIVGATNMSKPKAFLTGDAFKTKIRYVIGKPILPSEFPTGPEKKAAKELTEILENRVRDLMKQAESVL
ncbi:1-acyl-sn-glycerol-3-phosphate acyltransferase [Leptospira montravelensis]|uniref:1-acyl-sn-glycerol-3-phosphate acyltransferase n=2 Tax=Leptospiraceae TaxID=170 RepID=A0ABY2LR47_9LEPT|nr:1-acyl-sn-glycerol-3-phosphate acyltransferase [Leptospira montravelensis]TGL01591.1 1-acyl-sn-glycerol-3-phosphate acyltransferase [Leptospira montravelensis]